MYSEDSRTNSAQPRPEFAPNLEAMRAAGQIIIQQLVDMIAEKTTDGIGEKGERAANLHAPDDDVHTVFASRMSRGTNSDQPDQIGQVSYIERYGDQNGINFSIYDNGQLGGLRIKKDITSYGAKKIGDIHSTVAVNNVTDAVHLIAASRLAATSGSELPISFVSQLEAQSLLGLLTSLIPVEPPRRSYN